MDKLMHVKEDTSKPENRVNITLFHLLMIDEVKDFIVSKLGISSNCVIFPAPNLETEEFDTLDRPDYKIEADEKLTGYIEVELGKNPAQVEKYKTKTRDDVEVYSIFGKELDGGDLSLEEIYRFLVELQSTINKSLQKYWSIELLKRLIKYYVIDGHFNPSNKRITISDKMRDSEIITKLYDFFGEDKIKDGGTIERGRFLLDTVGEGGFSLKVYSRYSANKAFSLMNRTGGREIIYFPSYAKLDKYIDNKSFVEQYVNLLFSLGCSDIKYLRESQRTSLSMNVVENNMDEIYTLLDILVI